jgi:hypothetical protein
METPKITVYFSCRHCERLYRTSQGRQRQPGHFDCQDCGRPVHEWSGHYDFIGWQRIASPAALLNL